MSMTAKYTISGSILATIDGVEMTIPNDPGNRHYAELIASGVTIEPLAVPTPEDALAAWRSSAVASQAQIRLTLHQLGSIATVQAIADSDPAAAIVWGFAGSIPRASPLIDALKGDAFTDPQIDDIFAYAMGLEF
jgi:hypothetical protein